VGAWFWPWAECEVLKLGPIPGRDVLRTIVGERKGCWGTDVIDFDPKSPEMIIGNLQLILIWSQQLYAMHSITSKSLPRSDHQARFKHHAQRVLCDQFKMEIGSILDDEADWHHRNRAGSNYS